jgi:hypothetical protein
MKYDAASHPLMHTVHAYAHPCMHSLNFSNYQLSNHCKLDPCVCDISYPQVPWELDPAVLTLKTWYTCAHDYTAVTSNMAIHTSQPEYTIVTSCPW